MSIPVAHRGSNGPGRRKDPGKRHAILEAAKELFLRQGYDGVSMDAIASAAGVSKLTVYGHFRDKDTLFGAAVRARCEEQLPHAAFELRPDGGPLRAQLLEIGWRCHELVHSVDALRLYRLMAAQAAEQPRLAELFFEAGPLRALAEFETLIDRACEAGLLDVVDRSRAAEHFFCLVKGLAHMQVVIGARPPLAKAQARAHVEEVVDLFLKLYGHGLGEGAPCRRSS